MRPRQIACALLGLAGLGSAGVLTSAGAGARVASPAPIRFDVALGEQKLAGGREAIWALATATDATGRPVTLGTASARLGYDHFNWVQILIADPDVATCTQRASFYGLDETCSALTTVNGTLPRLPTFDPPPGGWRYEGRRFPTADFLPFYWDEYFSGSGAPSPAAPEYTEYETRLDHLPFDTARLGDFQAASLATARGLLFTDQPADSHVGTSRFVDALVGVRGRSCPALSPGAICPADLIAGTAFTWSADPDGAVKARAIPLDQFLTLSGSTAAHLAAFGLSLGADRTALSPSRR